jgi:hypothetical protein
MDSLRHLLLRHRALAALVFACALAMKLLVPAGYMAAPDGQMLTVSICADATGGSELRQIALPMKGDPAPSGGEHGKAPALCAFASLAMGAIGGADAPLLALALAFIVLLGLIAGAAPAPRTAHYLRPPLRGPPLTS